MQVEYADHENASEIDMTIGAPTIGTTLPSNADYTTLLSHEWVQRVSELAEEAAMNVRHFELGCEVDITE